MSNKLKDLINQECIKETSKETKINQKKMLDLYRTEASIALTNYVNCLFDTNLFKSLSIKETLEEMEKDELALIKYILF